MKDIKLSFPYPSTSRHNLSQDIATSLSMGLVIPVRVVKVLPGDSHRIGTSFSLLSNPLIKPLLQGVKMRYIRAWVPSRIYSIDQRANNMNFDPLNVPVRHGSFGTNRLRFPGGPDGFYSNFQQSSLFDYLQIANIESNFIYTSNTSFTGVSPDIQAGNLTVFNAEPYLGYIDFCRNYFADSSTGMIAWSSFASSTGSSSNVLFRKYVCVSPLAQLDAYIDNVQNSRSAISPYVWTRTNYTSDTGNSFEPFVLTPGISGDLMPVYDPSGTATNFSTSVFGVSHVGFCVPLNRPDRFSRLFDTRPLTSQNATIAPNEITIANLSFLEKMQRYLTRKFFGGTRYTDIMYSIFGQKVPHVDSPVILDIFDQELGTELVASTSASETQNPGVLGGYFASSGRLTSGRGSYKKRYTFNENGYILDMVYVTPRVYRSAFYPDFYPLSPTGSGTYTFSQGNFAPDFNGIGWQQPSFVSGFQYFDSLDVPASGTYVSSGGVLAFCSEPSWQQYRTLPDVCSGALAANRSFPDRSTPFGKTAQTVSVNSPVFVFSDRMNGFNYFTGFKSGDVVQTDKARRYMLAQFLFTDFNYFNRVFGFSDLTVDNIYVVFSYSHQAKRQVTKRFTLSF